jgi:oligoribonuclease
MQNKNNLVWIDLEMTGLDPQTDTILEIALIITDGELNLLDEGPHLVIHQLQESLDKMGPWVKEMHTASGLIKAVQESTITMQEAEKQTLNRIKQYCPPEECLLAGNTIWQDRNFLHRYMPSITNYMYYKLLDVTSVQQAVKRWYPNNPQVEFKKAEMHRALTDIRESIAELQHYRKYFFVP